MSESFRKLLWMVFLILTAVMIIAGCFPARKDEEYSYKSRGFSERFFSALPHLDPNDLSNTGNVKTLAVFPGVGETIAGNILSERERNGPFIYPEDLMAVYGIGEKKLEQIQPMLTVLTGEREE